MMERPIIFSAPMVSAILNGRKTQMRRVVVPQPPHSCSYVINGNQSHALCFGPNGECVPPTARSVDHRLRSPFGLPGDYLWVKESWMLGETSPNGLTVAKYVESDDEKHWRVPIPSDLAALASRRAGVRPSIHMPRWASRITLLVKAVRVERLQEISYADIYAEGIELHGTLVACMNEEQKALRGEFVKSWDAINAKKHPWASNPWVWVVEFERVNGGT